MTEEQRQEYIANLMLQRKFMTSPEAIKSIEATAKILGVVFDPATGKYVNVAGYKPTNATEVETPDVKKEAVDAEALLKKLNPAPVDPDNWNPVTGSFGMGDSSFYFGGADANGAKNSGAISPFFDTAQAAFKSLMTYEGVQADKAKAQAMVDAKNKDIQYKVTAFNNQTNKANRYATLGLVSGNSGAATSAIMAATPYQKIQLGKPIEYLG